jgi:hypothetical protein
VLWAHALGGLAFAGTVLLLVRPYLRLLAAHPELVKDERWLPQFSPPWRGLLTAGPDNWFWGTRQAGWQQSLSWWPEMALSPGIVLLVLAVAGIVFSVWSWRGRLGLVVAIAVLTVLAMGTAFPGGGRYTYLPLYHHLPGWSQLRTPGRLMIWVTLGLCLLAAGAVAHLYQQLRLVLNRPRIPIRLAVTAAAVLAVVPSAVVIVEGFNTTEHVDVPAPPVALKSLPSPALVLPADTADSFADYLTMLWGTDGWPVLANGSAGWDPKDQNTLREQAKTFPDQVSIEALRARGIRTVIIVPSRAVNDEYLPDGAAWLNAARRPVDGLGITRTDLGEAVIYDLRR